MASDIEIMQALATQIDGVLGPLIEDLQVIGGLVWNPTPPAIDIFPDDPYEEDISYGTVKSKNLVIRARVDTPDREGAQALLLSMMDSRATTSVEQAILSDDTIGGLVEQIAVVSGPAEFGAFVDPGGSALLGTTWHAQVLL